jgi:hypothetical protein
MDSPSSRSAHSTILKQEEIERGQACPVEHATDRAVRADTVLIAGFGEAVALDYAAFIGKMGRGDAVVLAAEKMQRPGEASVRSLPIDEVLRSTDDRSSDLGPVSSLVLFTSSRLTPRQRCDLDDILELARRCRFTFVGIISSFRLHLDDRDFRDVENHVLARASDMDARVVVFRPGHVLSPQSGIGAILRRFASFYPLLPRRLTSCFLEGAELFAAIEAERPEGKPHTGRLEPWQRNETTSAANPEGRLLGTKNRAYTLLGSNRPWRDMLFRHRTKGSGARLKTAVATLLSWLFIGEAAAVLLSLLARRCPRLRQWNVQILKPRSLGELLSLCHRSNFDQVKVVGYNNGVNHFGHRHPGKTVVSTVNCRRMVHAGPYTLKADCGTTVRNALDFLAKNNQELYVVPNYSYVCLGTSFFVPIHGSAVDFSTVADTICRVVFYDPDSDRIISAAREEPAFREHVYNMQSRVVVLRLYLLTKARSRYFIDRQTLESPSAGALLSALSDASATNVEIRQGHAASARVTVARYYTSLAAAQPESEIRNPKSDALGGLENVEAPQIVNGKRSEPVERPSAALELPRDTLGRLWDLLEENPVTSYLMHAVGRHVVWHTELFFTAEEFDLFWRTHGRLPLRKIQLRYLRRDGMPHSPCRESDCVSADLFLFRRHRSLFLDYLKATLPAARTNPGKHSH